MAGDDEKGLVPDCKVFIDGNEVARFDMVRAVVHTSVDLIDMATVTYRDSTGDTIDSDVYKQGNKVKIDLGFVGELKTVFWGEIVSSEPTFPKGRPPTITIRAYNPLYRMARQRKTRTFVEKKDSQVANDIAGEYGFSPNVDDSSSTIPYLLQNNLTDYAFLRSRADLIGYEMRVEDKDFFFRKPAAGDGEVVTLEWGYDLGEIDFRVTTGKQPAEVMVRSWDIQKKEAIIGKAKAGGETTQMGGSDTGPKTGKSAFGDSKTIVVREPVGDQAQADALAKTMLDELSMEHVLAEGKVWGKPEIVAGNVIKLTKLGATFDGPYYVMGAEHVFEADQVGYQVRFSLRRNVLKA